jgi:hypothetical protein
MAEEASSNMRELVAVTGFNPIGLENLKQKALLFDRIADVSLEGHIARLSNIDPPLAAELEWLADRGIVVEATAGALGVAPPITDIELEHARPSLTPADFDQLHQALRDYEAAQSVMYEQIAPAVLSGAAAATAPNGPQHQVLKWSFRSPTGAYVEANRSTNDRINLHTQFNVAPKYLRLTALRMRLLQGVDAVPLHDEHYYHLPTPVDAFVQPLGDGRNPVIQLVLRSLPMPDDSIAWEQIVDFRQDPSAKDAWYRLKDWMTDVARGGLKEPELTEKLEFLLRQFERSLEVHDLKTVRRPFEAFLVTSADIAESVLKLRLGKLAEGLFTTRRRRMDLLHTERTSPGAAVAYLFKAQRQFGRYASRGAKTRLAMPARLAAAIGVERPLPTADTRLRWPAGPLAVGVTGISALPLTSLKQKASFFDVLVDISGPARVRALRTSGDEAGAAELDRLGDQRFYAFVRRSYIQGGRDGAYLPSLGSMDAYIAPSLEIEAAARELATCLEGLYARCSGPDKRIFFERLDQPDQFQLLSCELRYEAAMHASERVDAFPLFPGVVANLSDLYRPGRHTVPVDVLDITISDLPLPDDATPWEAILEFRREASSRQAMRNLRSAIAGIAGVTQVEAPNGNGLDAAVDEYRQRLAAHSVTASGRRLQIYTLAGRADSDSIPTVRAMESGVGVAITRCQASLLPGERGRGHAFLACLFPDGGRSQ